jgi:hypothetical protein
MRLEDERDSFHGGGVGAFASFRETLFDEFFRVGEQRDALASFAFAAKVVFHPLAIRGLRKHSRQRELAEAARAAKEQRVRNAVATQSAAQGSDDSFVAEECGKAHVSVAFLCQGSREHLQNGG